MKITKLGEWGLEGALLGMGLSYKATVNVDIKDWYDRVYQQKSTYNLFKKMIARANKLAILNKGHNEFLKFIHVHYLVTAPDFWWGQMAQYHFVQDLSTSLMHSALERPLEQKDFEDLIPNTYLELLAQARLMVLNEEISFDEYIGKIPRGFLYTRVIDTNYLALRNIVAQRSNHKLPQWQDFCETVVGTVNYPDWIL